MILEIKTVGDLMENLKKYDVTTKLSIKDDNIIIAGTNDKLIFEINLPAEYAEAVIDFCESKNLDSSELTIDKFCMINKTAIKLYINHPDKINRKNLFKKIIKAFGFAALPTISARKKQNESIYEIYEQLIHHYSLNGSKIISKEFEDIRGPDDYDKDNESDYYHNKRQNNNLKIIVFLRNKYKDRSVEEINELKEKFMDLYDKFNG
jgi:hypothetical protein